MSGEIKLVSRYICESMRACLCVSMYVGISTQTHFVFIVLLKENINLIQKLLFRNKCFRSFALLC